MEKSENPNLSPMEYKKALEAQLKALRKIRKVYRKQVLPGSVLYHTSLRNVNKQISEVLDEFITLHKNHPETKKTLAQKLVENLEEWGKAAASASQQH